MRFGLVRLDIGREAVAVEDVRYGRFVEPGLDREAQERVPIEQVGVLGEVAPVEPLDQRLLLALSTSQMKEPMGIQRVACQRILKIVGDGHPLMGRMHRPDPKRPPNMQDKRSVVPKRRKQ